MQSESFSKDLMDSLLESIVSAAEKTGVEPHMLLSMLDEKLQEKPLKRLKRTHDVVKSNKEWWNVLPGEVTSYLFDFLPRKSLADFSECSKDAHAVVCDFAKRQLEKSELGKSLLKRHVEGKTSEKGSFSHAFLLHCVDAAPEAGMYFDSKDVEIQDEFNAMMNKIYPSDIYHEHSYVPWGRVMFMIEGIVVSQAVEGDMIGNFRFRVCRCPLPTMIRSLTAHSINAWISGGRVRRQDEMERLWQRGWSMYDWRVLEQYGINVGSDSEEDD